MTKIRSLYFFDKKDTKEMISFLNNSDYYTHHIMFNPLMPLHHLLPLRYKFLPESYVLKYGKNIKGLITVVPNGSPLKQVEIQKLLFEDNCYQDAGELIQYIVSKYKAMGTSSVLAKVDDYLPELIKLFVTRCGFSKISYEKTWLISNVNDSFNTNLFRQYHNTDASTIAAIYQEQLLPHFRPLLTKDAKEFYDKIFVGLSYCSEYKYVYQDKKSKTILAYISIKTSDNENYILDFIQSAWGNISIDDIIAFAYSKVIKRKQNAKLYILTKRYTQQGEQLERLFFERKYKCVKNQIILTNSSAGIIKNEDGEKKFIVLSPLFNSIGIANKDSL